MNDRIKAQKMLQPYKEFLFEICLLCLYYILKSHSTLVVRLCVHQQGSSSWTIFSINFARGVYIVCKYSCQDHINRVEHRRCEDMYCLATQELLANKSSIWQHMLVAIWTICNQWSVSDSPNSDRCRVYSLFFLLMISLGVTCISYSSVM